MTNPADEQPAFRQADASFRQFAAASSDVLWIRSAATLQLEYLSPAFERIYGTDRRRLLARPALESWLDLIVPEDRRAVREAVEEVRAGQQVTTEYRIRRKDDGSIRWMRNTKFPLLDEEGRVVRIGGIGQDTTEEKEASDRLHVLVAELQHRTRNLAAVIQAVADRTLRESASLADFHASFSDRLQAIVRVHGMLSRLGGGAGVAFDELLGEEMQAHGADSTHVHLEGPPGVRLRSTTLQTFALALHELATNAVKYGALSTGAGRLEVRWNIVTWEDGTPALKVEWKERGDAVPVQSGDRPATGGYGRELIERALPHQLKARTSYRIEQDGVHCIVEVALPQD